MSKGLLTALLVSLLLAVCLSLLPDHALDRFGGDAFGVDSKRDVPVMQMDGIVDRLSTLSVQGHLQKVSVANGKLTVTLAVPVSAVQQSRTYQDIYRIDRQFLTGKAAYKQVEVLVVSSDQPSNVQYAVVADQSDMAHAPQPGSAQIPTFVREQLQVIDKEAQ
ncbi:MAG: hypothetical protein ACXVOI_04840 [Tumebacillaceae bacterium]